MSPIIRKTGVVLGGMMLLLSQGCSDPHTPRSLINPDTGRHDTLWESPDSHGTSAKATATSTSGLAACQECHADNFMGGISNRTCLNTDGCHGASVGAPHSPKPWRGGIRTHTNTDESNAPICAICHTNGANSSLQPSPFDTGRPPDASIIRSAMPLSAILQAGQTRTHTAQQQRVNHPQLPASATVRPATEMNSPAVLLCRRV